ncbi:MAG TPA: acyl carrier protein [Treponemataceae bacterium]|jgi:acyl carrier protein|nr:acyl carrier protein [Treponemataceae bacterium]
MTKSEIFNKMRDILVDTFELDAAKVVPEARLLDDLDLDSIDAVDLIVKLQQIIGRKIDPEVFKQVRTVGDVVDAISALLNEGAGA